MTESMAIDAAASPSVSSVTPSYRRNGKLFSCEPCRRGKLRCDHVSPVCGRCARRNKPDQCVYHPAPLTKPRTSSGTVQQRTPAPSSRSSTAGLTLGDSSDRPPSVLASPPSVLNQHQPPPPQHDYHQQDFSAFRPLNATAVPLSQTATVHSPVLLPMDTPSSTEERQTSSGVSYASPESSSMSFRDNKIGFLGNTSYNAVYTENAGSLSVINEFNEGENTSNLAPIPAERIQQGADVLALLRDMPVYQRFTQRFFDLSEGILMMSPAVRIWIDDLWAEFGQLLQEGRPDQLRGLSEMVWRNTRKPIKVSGQMSAREWAMSATGRFLRWEIVGIILSLVGLIAVNLSDWDAIFDSIREKFVDRATFANRMRKASEFILCFCYECETLNELYVCFLYENLILVEAFKGEAHYAAWQRTGELLDAVVAMGLHQGNPVDPETPFFLSDLRKKIFCSAYGRDKFVASFLGRPPRLSHRYCKMEMPLDLSDEQIFLEGQELEAALSSLDANGWNTSGTLSRTTWNRLWFQHCRIREDILEIALGSGDDDISHRAEQVRARLDHLHNSNPDFMKITPEDVINRSAVRLGAAYHVGRTEMVMSQMTCMFALCSHLGIVQTEFLLRRALINRQRSDTKELIPLSRRLLELVLLAQSRRDFFRDFQGDLVYLMAVHGLPAAGVLAIELLKQEQSKMYTPDILPRSETIQDLSVFISSLAAVRPGEGNYSICNQGRKALKKVLDQILSPQPYIPGAHQQGGGAAGQGGAGGVEGPSFDDMGLYFPTGNDADFLQWLENVEWDRGNWMGAPTAQQQQQQQPPPSQQQGPSAPPTEAGERGREEGG